MRADGYLRLDTDAERRQWGPIPEQDRPQLLAVIRECANTACVDCGAPPLGGGLRCEGCFLAVAEPGRVRRARQEVVA